MAENMSAYFVTCWALFFGEAVCIFPQLQKYQGNVKGKVVLGLKFRPCRCNLGGEQGVNPMRKWLVAASVILSAVVLTAATYASHAGKCPLCWFK
jgi:hypothetical protein